MKVLLRKIGKHLYERQYAYICAFITLGLLVLGFFAFPNALGRMVESVRDIGYSIVYVVCDLCSIEVDIPVKVNDYPDYNFLNVRSWVYSLFEESAIAPTYKVLFWEDIVAGWKKYWTAWIDTDNMLLYVYYVEYYVVTFLPIIILALPISWGVKKLFNKYYFKEKRKKKEEAPAPLERLEESRLLRAWHWFYFNVIERVELWFCSLYAYVRDREELYQFWLLLLFLYFNVFTIMFEFAAYYLYFAVSLDALSLYRQGYKLWLDLSGVVAFIGWISWITLFILVLKSRVREWEFRSAVLCEVVQ